MLFKQLKKLYFSFYDFFKSVKSGVEVLRRESNEQKILTANILTLLNQKRTEIILADIQQAEFKVFSEWKDDGIIQFLAGYINFPHKTFIEFGVEDYTEANTRFLLVNNNWSGLIMDGSAAHMEKVRREKIYWRYELTAVAAFITAENINGLISAHGFQPEVGILHIDLDGNDYFVWKAIHCISPVLVIVEYNSIFGYEKPWTIPYDAAFDRMEKHYSKLYFGSSLLSLCDLAEERGYIFIGCNSNGNNAYFIKKEYAAGLKPLTAATGYIMSRFRESQSREGYPTLLQGDARLAELTGMPVFNTRTHLTELI